MSKIWNATRVADTAVGSIGYATYHVKILLGEEAKKDLSLKMRTVLSAYRVYLDSAPLVKVGEAADNKEDFVRRIEPLITRLPDLQNRDEIDLFFQIANFDDKSGGFYQEAIIGDYSALFERRVMGIAYQTLLVGALFSFVLVLVMMVKKADSVSTEKKRIALYAVFNVVVIARILLTGERVLYTLFPHVSTRVFLLGEYLLFYAIFVLVQCCFYYIVPNRHSLIFTKITVALGAVISVLTLFLPFGISSYFIDFWQYYSLIMLVNLVYLMVRRPKMRDADVYTQIFGITAFLVCGIHDMAANSFGVALFDRELLPLGMLVFSSVNILLFLREVESTLDKQNDEVMRRVKQQKRLNTGIVSIVAEMVESRDNLTGKHIERTALYTMLLIEKMQQGDVYKEEVSKWDIKMVMASSRLHDVGKIAVSDLVLNKPGKLSPDEFEKMKTHCFQGGVMIDRISNTVGNEEFLTHAKLFAEYHHERWDGEGYPYKLFKENIPLEGRIMAIVDVYDALTSKRIYKAAFSHEKAVEIIASERGKAFDPLITDVFLANDAEFDRWRKLLSDEEETEL